MDSNEIMTTTSQNLSLVMDDELSELDFRSSETLRNLQQATIGITDVGERSTIVHCDGGLVCSSATPSRILPIA